MPDKDVPEFEVIIAYTRTEALDDGVLMDVSSTAREAGFKVPVAVTRAVWTRYVLLSPTARVAGNDERGRLWDILWMFRMALLRPHNASEIVFSLYVVTDFIQPSLVELKAICGPGDDAETVITIMLPSED